MDPEASKTRIGDVVKAVTGDAAIDWDELRDKRPEQRSLLRNLEFVHRIATAYRELGAGTSSGDLADRTPKLEGVEAGQVPADCREGLQPDPPLGREQHIEPDIGSRWGTFLLLEKIDEGSFGEIYRAFDPELQNEIALKLCLPRWMNDEDIIERFLEEARALARVRHENVLAVHGAGLHDGRVGLWTELIRGRTLKQIVQVTGTYGAEEAAHIGSRLCSALAAIHGQGLVHRDIQPSNVMREAGSGRLLLVDLGSAGPNDSSDENDGPPVCVTPCTCAPEILLETGDPSVRSDIYSLGALLYWLVSGRYPIEAQSISELRDKHLGRERKPLADLRPDLPQGFVNAIERALEFDPTARFASAGAMQSALAVVAQGTLVTGPIHAVTEERRSGSTARSKWQHRSLFMRVLLAGCIALAGVGVYVLTRPPLRVKSALIRAGDHATEILNDGAQLELGDALFLDIHGSKPMYVYAFSQDAGDSAVVMFPSGTDVLNPLSERQHHRLPGSLQGVQQDWLVTETGSAHTFVVVASLVQLPLFETLVTDLPHAIPGYPVQTAALDPATPGDYVDRGMRGTGPHVPSKKGAVQPIDELVRTLNVGKGREKAWIRVIRLAYATEAGGR